EPLSETVVGLELFPDLIHPAQRQALGDQVPRPARRPLAARDTRIVLLEALKHVDEVLGDLLALEGRPFVTETHGVCPQLLWMSSSFLRVASSASPVTVSLYWV